MRKALILIPVFISVIFYGCNLNEDSGTDPVNNDPLSLTLNSPEPKYYDTVQDLDFTLTGPDDTTLQIDLNGMTMNYLSSGDSLPTETGLNTLTITATDGDGNSEEETVTFFINDLHLNAIENFNYADNTEPEVLGEYSVDGDRILYVKDNAMIARDASATGNNDQLVKSYGGAHPDPKSIQHIQLNYQNPEVRTDLFLIYWAVDGSMDQVQVMLSSPGNSTDPYTFSFQEYYSMTGLAYDIDTAVDVEISDFTNPYHIYFMRNLDQYQTVLTDSEMNLVAMLSNDYFIMQTDNVFNNIGIQVMHSDNSNDGDTLIELDDYSYYR